MRRRWIVWLVVALLCGAAGAWWVLLNPDNAFTRLFARDISDVRARIIIGPYPAERDLRLLKDNGVVLIVTLLDPAIPYEATLLAQERERAARFGFTLENYPMSSVLGQRFGRSYDENAIQAADSIARSTGKVYLHCYLGMHRIQVVRDILATRGVVSGTYTVRQGERSEARVDIDKAEADYGAGRYDQALARLTKLDDREVTVDARLLLGWSFLRLNRVGEARAAFERVIAGDPGHVAAATGLGYCALRDGDNEAARRHFAAATVAAPQNADALGGLGLALFRLGRMDEAVKALETSLRVAPNGEFEAALGRARAGTGPPNPRR